jgi:hypothetical protein
VQLAYAIGVAEPVSVYVDTFGTGHVDDEKISELVRAHFKLTPKGIIETLDLRRPIYKKTAAFGHFGRTEPEFTWERYRQGDRAPGGCRSLIVADGSRLKFLLTAALVAAVVFFGAAPPRPAPTPTSGPPILECSPARTTFTHTLLTAGSIVRRCACRVARGIEVRNLHRSRRRHARHQAAPE